MPSGAHPSRTASRCTRGLAALALVVAVWLGVFQPLFVEHRRRIKDLALRHRLPTISDGRAFAEAGGLMSYGADRADLHRQVAVYVDRILNGAKPADLPLVEPTRFDLTINLNTAQALGLDIPSSVLLRADHVIRP